MSRFAKDGIAAEPFFAKVVGLPDVSDLSSSRVGLFLLANTVILSTFGGWFGSALFPPVQKRQVRLDRGSV